MPQIKVQTNDSPFFEWFQAIGYIDPTAIFRNPDKFDFDKDWYYVNANGYAQKYDVNRPPSRFPCLERLILVKFESRGKLL